MSRTTRLIGTLLVAGALATSCSGGSTATSGAAQHGGTPSAPAAGAGSATAAPAASAGASAASAGAPVAAPGPGQDRRVLTADVVVAVDDVAGAAQQVRAVAATAGGSVSEESVDLTGAPGAARGRLVLRVPPTPLDDTIARVAAAGTEVSRTRSAQDVEATLVDVASRIATQSASVDRVRALLGSATSLTDVVALEGALTSRTADLESLKAQQAVVQGRVEQATLTVELQRTVVVAAAGPDRTGFLGGVRGGWRALASAVRAGLTVLGAVLPFLLVAAVLGAPVGWLLRRRGRVAPED